MRDNHEFRAARVHVGSTIEPRASQSQELAQTTTAFGQCQWVTQEAYMLVMPRIQPQISPSTLLHFSRQGNLSLAVGVVLPRLG